MTRAVYLDNNATTRPDPEVVAEMMPYLTEHFGNPSSPHGFGAASRRALKVARQRVAALIGAAGEDEILLTSGGTESNNTAIRAALAASDVRNEIVVSAVEHPATLELAAHLERRGRARVRAIPVDARGRLDRDAFRAALSPNVALVSLMFANNETGVVFPVAELASEAKACGALVHIDAVQAAGRAEIALRDTAIDLVSLSAHKLHGPKGVGALYVRRGLNLTPWLRGGHQERGRRAGTENVAGAAGFGKAAEIAATRLRGDATRMRALRNRMESTLQRALPELMVLGQEAPRLPNTSALVVPGVEADAVALILNRAGVAVSTGAACASGARRQSHVLAAMGLQAAIDFGATRVSLSRDSDDEDIDRLLTLLPDIVGRLRSGRIGAAELAA